jgi:hypothetical protein
MANSEANYQDWLMGFYKQLVADGGDAQATLDSITEEELRAIYNAAHAALDRRLAAPMRFSESPS